MSTPESAAIPPQVDPSPLDHQPAPARQFEDRLFELFPQRQEHQLASGTLCQSPFFVPDSAAWMLFGTVELPSLREILAPEPFQPVSTDGGKAMACLWLSDFRDSTVGPYRELTVTFFVARNPLHLKWRNFLTPLAAQFHPEVLVCEYILVLDEQAAIEYGRDLHGFDKHPGDLRFEQLTTPSPPTTRVSVDQDDGPVVRVTLSEKWTTASTLHSVFSLFAAHGFFSTFGLLTKRVHQISVVTPRTVRAMRTNIFFSGRASVRPWGGKDSFRAGSARIGRLIAEVGFQPVAVQKFLNAKGIMPLPVETL